jgi:hypothetical protein
VPSLETASPTGKRNFVAGSLGSRDGADFAALEDAAEPVVPGIGHQQGAIACEQDARRT